MVPLSTVLGSGLSAVETIQQAFSPAISVLVSPEVDLICGKNRLTFVELLQPFSRLSAEGQIRDVNNALHTITQFRLSVRDISWKPASTVLSRRLLSEAVSNCTVPDNKILINRESGDVEINPYTPWYDAWRETLWSCLELTDHDFTRHYLATLLVVSSSHTNPMEQFQHLNNQLQQLIWDRLPRFFNSMVLRYFVLLHDTCEGDASKAEEIFQSMKNAFGSHACHLLVINSKPKKGPGSHVDVGLPAPDPWLKFLPRKPSKLDSASESESGSESTPLASSMPDLPSKVEEGSNLPSMDMKLPLMDALQEAMQEVGILAPSASTTALSSLTADPAASPRIAVEVRDDPLSGGLRMDGQADSADHVDSVSSASSSTATTDGVEIHGGCLTTDDVDRVQNFINEFCLKSLLPHMERQMKLLSEAAAARKSTHRSFLSATKRLFGSSRPGTQSGPPAVAVSYHPESAQLQVRRLGDLAFLLGHYELAYTSYHTAKKDFEADQAWLHFAGASEMAALSVFLQGGSGRNIPFHYIEVALTTYLHTCKMANWATRCAVLSSECRKSVGQYGDAALQLIRMTSEDADLRSAILLEQAALCFLRSAIKVQPTNTTSQPKGVSNSPLLRKYGFHMILAGHRFGKSGQKRHASRAYQLALQVYRGHGWSLAEDHIHYTIGRQCLSGQQIEAACQALAALLKPHSMQTPSQQTAYLNEFIHVHQMMSRQPQTGASSKHPHSPILPLPLVDSRNIKTLVETKDATATNTPVQSPGTGVTEASHVTFSDDEAHHPRWGQLEEKLVIAAHGSIPMTFRPTNVLFTGSTTNTQRPVTHCNEMVSLEVPLENPLHIPLLLCEIRLLWTFEGADGRLSNTHLLSKSSEQNPSQLLVTTYTIPRLLLQPSSSQRVILHIKPKVEGLLIIQGIGFEIRLSKGESSGAGPGVAGKVLFDVRGPRMNSTVAERQGKVYATDRRLEIQVGPAMPKLRVLFHHLPEFLLSGEIRHVQMELVNVHPHITVGNIFLASNDPQHVVVDLPRVTLPAKHHDPQVAVYAWDVSKKSTSMWLRGSETDGLRPFDLLLYYANPTVKSSYRVLRHCSKIYVSSSLALNAFEQLVPSVVNRTESGGGPITETLALQIEVRNLRDADDTALSGIRINQVSLLSQTWRLQKEESTVPEGLLHPQENLISSLRAVHEVNNNGELLCESITVGTSKDLMVAPYKNFIKEFQSSTSESTVLVSWTANQASEDGYGSSIIEGQHYIALNHSSNPLKPLKQVVTYSMDYPTKVEHNFSKSRLCVIPVVLYVHNNTRSAVVVRYVVNANAGKPNGAPTQLYMPEAASPFLWVGRVQGEVHLSAERPSEAIELAIAVSRPGAFSLARGLQIIAELIGSEIAVPCSKLEFTLAVENKES